MSRKFHKAFGIVAIGLVVLVIAAACGGGGDEEAAPTATPTTAPPTSTPAPTDGEATPTPVPATPTPTSGGVAPSDGAPTPEPFTGGEEIPATLLELEMLEVGGSGQSGTAALIQIERKTKVSVSITPGPPGVSQAAMI
ncbi:MAG: hypothetical protein ACE5JL_12200, partial [Dehalococcoidia bacterium]